MFDIVFLVSVVAVAMIYAISAFGLLVTYRVAGVFNLAFGYQAAFAAFLYWQCAVGWGIDKYVSAVLVAAIAMPLFGVAIQQALFRQRRDVLTGVIVTIGLGVALNGLIQTLWKTSDVRRVPSLFGEDVVSALGTNLSVNELGVIVLTGVIAFAVAALLHRSRAGLRMRAVVDAPELAGATGIPYGRVSALAWAVSSCLAGMSGILLAPLLNLDVNVLSTLVVDSFVVAVFAGLSSMRLAVVGALLLAYLQGVTELYPTYFEFLSGSPRDVLPFIMLAIVLLVHPLARRQIGVVGAGLERVARERAAGSWVRAAAMAIVIAAALAAINDYWTFVAINVAIASLAALSIVMLTGASAQISLCQFTFLGLGAIGLAKLTEAGAPWILAAAAGVVLAMVAGLIVALTAFRLRGIFLALISLAFAYAALIVLFQNDRVIGAGGLFAERPVGVLGLDFTDERTFLALVVLVLVVAIVAVGTMLQGPWGRALQTLTAGDAVAGVSGLPVRLWKMAVFVVSAGLAGLAGALYIGANGIVTAESFVPAQSLTLLVVVVVGGITSPSGAVLAGLILVGSPELLDLVVSNAGNLTLIIFGLTAMQIGVMHPQGLAGLPAQLAARRWPGDGMRVATAKPLRERAGR